MAKEDKKDFNAMLADSRDTPKIQIVTDERTIQTIRRKQVCTLRLPQPMMR